MNDLINLFLHLGDNSMILSHRLAEYSSKGPFLEEDLATTNVALDHLGIAELFYEAAAEMGGGVYTANDIAYRRTDSGYFNFLLVEQPNTDFAYIIARQFFMDAFNYYYFSELSKSINLDLSAIATKSLKEITYHLRRSSEWMIRLGDGTAEANQRLQVAVNHLWKFTAEFFVTMPSERELITQKVLPEMHDLQRNWRQKIAEIFYMAKLKIPADQPVIKGGKSGVHSEYLGHILSEMQYLVNKYPDAIW